MRTVDVVCEVVLAGADDLDVARVLALLQPAHERSGVPRRQVRVPAAATSGLGTERCATGIHSRGEDVRSLARHLLPSAPARVCAANRVSPRPAEGGGGEERRRARTAE